MGIFNLFKRRKTQAQKLEQNTNDNQAVLQYLLEEKFINEQQMKEMKKMSLEERLHFLQELMRIQRLQSTGVEFGGLNTDLSLNPGMQQEQMNSFMNNSFMNDFHDSHF